MGEVPFHYGYIEYYTIQLLAISAYILILHIIPLIVNFKNTITLSMLWLISVAIVTTGSACTTKVALHSTI